MKLDNETHLEVTLKNNEKIPGNLFLKNLENPGIVLHRMSRNPCKNTGTGFF